jgi:fatty-acyl-CoA synthase
VTVLETPWALISKSFAADRDRVAVIDDTGPASYGELAARAERLARWLIARTGKGDRVALLLGNTVEYVVADLALLRAGLVKVPLNPMLSDADVAHILEHSGAVMAFVASAIAPTAIPDGYAGVTIDASTIGLPGGDGDGDALRPASGGDPALLLYTGGTTGRPKGVLHSARSVASNIVAHIHEGDVRRYERMLLATALSHSAGLFLQAGLASGATIVVQSRFTPAGFLAALREHDARWTSLVPTMLYRVLDDLGDAEPPALDTVVYGSAPITPTRMREAVDRFGPVLVQLYGQSEVPNWGTTLSKGDHARARDDDRLLGSSGRASMLAELSIRLEDGSEAPAGTIGEICLRAPYAFDGYWDNPEATAETIVDGWVHTRDIGLVDDEGYLFIKDRLSDMIITGGYNVYSSEVEAVLQRFPEVAQVAVIGLPDADWGETVCAVVVLAEGCELDEAALLARSRDELGSYKRPKSARFLADIPVTPFGKPDKKALRARFGPAGASR